MSEYLSRDTVPDLASYARNDASRTSYTISSGIVGSSLKRPRTLLERPVLTLPRFLLELALALFVGRSSGGADVGGRTEKNSVRNPFRGACKTDMASWLAEAVGSGGGGHRGTHHAHYVKQHYGKMMRQPAYQSRSTRRTPGGRYTSSCKLSRQIFATASGSRRGKSPGPGYMPHPHRLAYSRQWQTIMGPKHKIVNHT